MSHDRLIHSLECPPESPTAVAILMKSAARRIQALAINGQTQKRLEAANHQRLLDVIDTYRINLASERRRITELETDLAYYSGVTPDEATAVAVAKANDSVVRGHNE